MAPLECTLHWIWLYASRCRRFRAMQITINLIIISKQQTHNEAENYISNSIHTDGLNRTSSGVNELKLRNENVCYEWNPNVGNFHPLARSRFLLFYFFSSTRFDTTSIRVPKLYNFINAQFLIQVWTLVRLKWPINGDLNSSPFALQPDEPSQRSLLGNTFFLLDNVVKWCNIFFLHVSERSVLAGLAGLRRVRERWVEDEWVRSAFSFNRLQLHSIAKQKLSSQRKGKNEETPKTKKMDMKKKNADWHWRGTADELTLSGVLFVTFCGREMIDSPQPRLSSTQLWTLSLHCSESVPVSQLQHSNWFFTLFLGKSAMARHL